MYHKIYPFKVYSLMVFNIFRIVGPSIQYNIRTFSSTSKRNNNHEQLLYTLLFQPLIYLTRGLVHEILALVGGLGGDPSGDVCFRIEPKPAGGYPSHSQGPLTPYCLPAPDRWDHCSLALPRRQERLPLCLPAMSLASG
uniref:Uncharacterized protein n=1 Tax=Myotis myotis TaxID=51298 RepID=A0A7J7VYL1_MYOMY|nr:hypothetical protein mMyoMyo1_012296 [Myotis myotis]